MLVSGVLTATRTRLNELTPSTWTDAALLQWINEANADIARQVPVLKAELTVPLTLNVNEYTLSATVREVLYAYYLPGDGRRVPLQLVQYESMDFIWGDTQNSNNSSTPIYATIKGYSPNLKLVLFPPPAVSANVLLIAVVSPALIPLDGSGNAVALDMIDQWVPAVFDYVEMCAWRRAGDSRWQEAKGLYDEKIGQIMANIENLNATHQILPTSGFGGVPRWIADWNY